VQLDDLVNQIKSERRRQEYLKAEGKFPATCADDIPNGDRLAVLVEEVGEVASAMQDADAYQLVRELIEVIAVATAWLQSIDIHSVERIRVRDEQTEYWDGYGYRRVAA
jgi:NTP pyrophosphatase (non-canonical NTP hydrolase)